MAPARGPGGGPAERAYSSSCRPPRSPAIGFDGGGEPWLVVKREIEREMGAERGAALYISASRSAGDCDGVPPSSTAPAKYPAFGGRQ